MKRFIYTLLIALVSVAAHGQTFNVSAGDVPGPVLTDSIAINRLLSWKPDRTARATHDWAAIAAPMIKGCRTKYDKARAIYRWLCDNITYDYTYTIYDAETCYEKRTGVCNAYALLFCKLANAVGVDAYRVVGDAKTSIENRSETGGHAWVKIYTDDNRRYAILADPTWGAGDQADTWFNVDPSWMLFTHLPKNDNDQLIADKVDKATFLKFPYIFAGLKILGIKGKPYLDQYRRGNEVYIPSFNNNNLRNNEKYTMPQNGVLTVGKTYNFVVNGDRELSCWYSEGCKAESKIGRRGRTNTISIRPTEPGLLNITLGDNWIVTYKVEKMSVR